MTAPTLDARTAERIGQRLDQLAALAKLAAEPPRPGGRADDQEDRAGERTTA